jgi:hypothetical protein
MLTDFDIETREGRERGSTETWVVCLRKHPRRMTWSAEAPVTLRNAAQFVEWLTRITAEHDLDHADDPAPTPPGPKPYLIEQIGDTAIGAEGSDSYVQAWWVPPPAKGVKYRVIEDEWDDELTARAIRAIELVESPAPTPPAE